MVTAFTLERVAAGVEAPPKWTVTNAQGKPDIAGTYVAAGVEAKPASTLTALDDGRYDKPASKEEQDEKSNGVLARTACASGHFSTHPVGDSSSTVKRFTIEVLQEKDGRWLADIPSVPGAMAYGKTEWEAVWKRRGRGAMEGSDFFPAKRMMVSHGGEIHEECPDCRGACCRPFHTSGMGLNTVRDPAGGLSALFTSGSSGRAEAAQVSALLGKYLNTMVADLGIDGKGQYLRDLFSRYEAELEAAAESRAEKQDGNI